MTTGLRKLARLADRAGAGRAARGAGSAQRVDRGHQRHSGIQERLQAALERRRHLRLRNHCSIAREGQ